MILAFVPSESASHVLIVQQEAQISQFLINLMPEFKPVRADLMNREIPADSDTCVQGVLREEIRLQSQTLTNYTPRAFSTQQSEETALLAPKGQKVQCFECKGYGHIARQCKKKSFCNYCQRSGHVIYECTRRPVQRFENMPPKNQTAFQAQTSRHEVVANATTPTSDEIRDMIQSLVNASVTSAFTTMRITGQVSSYGSFYFFTLMVH